MQTLTVKDAKQNFGDLLLNAQHESIKISENGKDAVVIMSIKDYEALEEMKSNYLKLCFESAQDDISKGNLVDGKQFLTEL